MFEIHIVDDDIAETINGLAKHIHELNQTWWHNPATGEPIVRNKGELVNHVKDHLIALMHSELSEALEGERKGSADAHLPLRPSAEVELADCLIRILDYCGGFGYDLGGALKEKLEYNAKRADHKVEARLAFGGKKF